MIMYQIACPRRRESRRNHIQELEDNNEELWETDTITIPFASGDV
jgi:hypothetical protein